MDKLRECPLPWCGSGNVMRRFENLDGGYEKHWIECGTCGIRSIRYDKAEDAVKCWHANRLPRPTGKGELVALEDVVAKLEHAAKCYREEGLPSHGLTIDGLIEDIRALPRHDGEAGRLRAVAIELRGLAEQCHVSVDMLNATEVITESDAYRTEGRVSVYEDLEERLGARAAKFEARATLARKEQP